MLSVSSSRGPSIRTSIRPCFTETTTRSLQVLQVHLHLRAVHEALLQQYAPRPAGAPASPCIEVCLTSERNYERVRGISLNATQTFCAFSYQVLRLENPPNLSAFRSPMMRQVYIARANYEWAGSEEARPPPLEHPQVPFCMAKRGTKRVLEYARLAMGFANARASRYGIR